MKRFIIILIVITLIMAVAGSASANYYHNLTIQVEGEYNFEVNSTLPESSLTLDFEGVGKAFINSDLRILKQDLVELQKWWSLF